MSKQATETDVVAGLQVRARRQQLGLTQIEIAKRLGISFQQLQKYERGMNRIHAGRLEAIAGILQVPVSYFFPEPRDPMFAIPTREAESRFREESDLPRELAKVGNPAVRKAVSDLVIALVEEEPEATCPA